MFPQKVQRTLKGVLFIAAYTLTQTAGAQVTDFKLSDFKYRTPGFKALGVSGRSNSAYSSTTGSGGSFSLYPNITYLSKQSTDNKQQSLQMGASAGFNVRGGDSDKERGAAAGADVNFLLRRFTGKYFIETGINGGADYGNINNITQKNKEIRTPYNVQLTLGAGTGRLENVSDAQMALFILNDLKAAGKIKGTVSKEQAAAFARLITMVYNQRIFDFRKRRMYELEQLHGFLKTNKLIDASDITVFNIISDNWAFAIQPNAIDGITATSGTLVIANLFDDVSDRYNLDGIFDQPVRYAGRQLFARLLPAVATNNDFKKVITDTSSVKTGDVTYGVTAQIGYEERKPLNIHWQLDKHATISYSSNSKKNAFTSSVTKSSGLTAVAGVGLGYYPNSRTVVQGFGTLAALYNLDKNAAGGKFSVSPTVRVVANYFVNYNARLTAAFSTSYFSNNYGGTFSNSFLINFDVGYRVYIF